MKILLLRLNVLKGLWEILYIPYIYNFKLPESFGNRFKMILLAQEINFLKNLIEKYLFFVEKTNFKNAHKKIIFQKIKNMIKINEKQRKSMKNH